VVDEYGARWYVTIEDIDDRGEIEDDTTHPATVDRLPDAATAWRAREHRRLNGSLTGAAQGRLRRCRLVLSLSTVSVVGEVFHVGRYTFTCSRRRAPHPAGPHHPPARRRSQTAVNRKEEHRDAGRMVEFPATAARRRISGRPDAGRAGRVVIQEWWGLVTTSKRSATLRAAATPPGPTCTRPDATEPTAGKLSWRSTSRSGEDLAGAAKFLAGHSSTRSWRWASAWRPPLALIRGAPPRSGPVVETIRRASSDREARTKQAEASPVLPANLPKGGLYAGRRLA